MWRNAYQYALVFCRQDHSPIGQLPAPVDWLPAVEYARFNTWRRNPRGDDGKADLVTMIEPRWDEIALEPYVGAIRVTVSANGAGSAACEIPTTYFHALAQQLASGLVQRGVLKPGEVFLYLVCAFRQEARRLEGTTPGVAVEELSVPLALQDTPLTTLAGRAASYSELAVDEFPVFIPQAVLDETAELARAAESVETGGVLLGRLHRDRALPEILLEVTAQIAASHTLAQADKLTFTAETWAAARSAAELRGGGTAIIGWWHSHPARAWSQISTAEEAAEKRLGHATALNFFSDHDLLVQRTVFPKAYHIGLVVTDALAGMQFALFGWRQGMIERRGFHVLQSPRRNGTPVAGIGKLQEEIP